MRFLFPLFAAISLCSQASATPIQHGDLNPAFVDLHFGTLSGVGWYANETGGVLESSATSSVARGEQLIHLHSTAGFVRGQLACYEGEKGELYPLVIKDVKPDLVVVDRPLPSAMKPGAHIYNFYGNDAHANHYGYACTVDDALRQLATRPMLRRAAQYKASSGWEPISGAQIVPATNVGYGGISVQLEDAPAIAVHVGSAGGGVASKPITSFYEYMVTNIVLNPGQQSGKPAATIDIIVTELRSTGEIVEVARTQVTRDDTIASIDIPYTITAGSQVRVKLIVPNSSGAVFYPGPITHYHALSASEDINRGKHVLLGDSWFASGGDIHNHLIKRLDKATVISKGIVGNRSDQMVERFFKDVPAEKPDYVWIMAGTNDYYQGNTSQIFQFQITYLLDYIRSIGAKPIVFNPTVGAMVPGIGGNQLLNSRSFALNTLYVPAVSFLRSPLLQHITNR